TMNEAATPRVRRPSWRDPRLGVGVLLVAGSVALGSWTVSRADDTVTVYTTATVLSPGDQVDVEDLVATQVQVPALAETYLTPGEEPATGLVVLRTVGEGEMVPLAALGSAQSVQVRTVTVPVDAALAESIRPGAVVDLWVALPADGGAGAGATLAAPEHTSELQSRFDLVCRLLLEKKKSTV